MSEKKKGKSFRVRLPTRDEDKRRLYPEYKKKNGEKEEKIAKLVAEMNLSILMRLILGKENTHPDVFKFLGMDNSEFVMREKDVRELVEIALRKGMEARP